MKKICYVTTIPYTLEMSVLASARYLHESGNYKITFICDFDTNFKEKLPSYINYIPVKMSRGINLDGIMAVYKLVKIFKKEKFDLVQYCTPNASLYASIAAKITNVPVRLYCQWGIYYVGLTGIKRHIFKLSEKIVSTLSTWIEPDSYGNLSFSHDEGLYKNSKSSVVGKGSAAGVDLSKFDHKMKEKWKNELLIKYNINPQKKIIGFVGRVTKDKGINELLNAYSKLSKSNDVILMIIGDPENVESLDQKLYKWSLKNKNIFYINQTTEIEKYYALMDMFVLPSYREGFGSVVIEAEAMGVPVIVTDIPGPREAMMKRETGLIVNKENPEDLFLAMKYLVQNEDIAYKMGQTGIEFVKVNFDSQKVYQLILEDRNKLITESLLKQ